MSAETIDAWWRRTPWIFAVIALIASVGSALILPPFMAPDEPAHAYRAILPTTGAWAAHRIEGAAAGGTVDLSLVELFDVYEPIRHHPERQVGPAHGDAAGRLGWDGRVFAAQFPNTAIYSPLAYLPVTAGFAAGKLAGVGVADTVRLARIANALACIAVGVLALRLGGATRALTAGILLLPMSSFLFGSISQDGVCLALTALGAALLTRGRREARALTEVELWTACAAFTVVGLAKLPYALFGLAVLWIDHPSRWRKTLAAVAPLVLGGLWTGWTQVTLNTATEAGRGVDAAAQLAWLMDEPLRLPRLAADTLITYGPSYVKMGVGVLGWIDTPLPVVFYGLALGVLAALAGLAAYRAKRVMPLSFQVAVVALALLAMGGVFAVFHLTWTPVGSARVEGIQGRYFLGPALFLCAMLEARDPPAWVKAWSLGLLSVLGVTGTAALIYALQTRFYG